MASFCNLSSWIQNCAVKGSSSIFLRGASVFDSQQGNHPSSVLGGMSHWFLYHPAVEHVWVTPLDNGWNPSCPYLIVAGSGAISFLITSGIDTRKLTSSHYTCAKPYVGCLLFSYWLFALKLHFCGAMKSKACCCWLGQDLKMLSIVLAYLVVCWLVPFSGCCCVSCRQLSLKWASFFFFFYNVGTSSTMSLWWSKISRGCFCNYRGCSCVCVNIILSMQVKTLSKV